jgi:hypothetical protein
MPSAHHALQAYNIGMLDLFMHGLSHLLVPMFLTGMIGSLVVVVITLVHDINDFFSDNGDGTNQADGLN